MRMRKKPNLIPRMQACERIWIKDPVVMKGRWKTLLPSAREIRLEIGCGKGKFTVETAKLEPDILLIALEKVPDAMVMAMEYAMREELTNVFFIDADAQCLPDLFEDGEIDLIYLNFCDPWPRNRTAKLRLTYHTFLEKYKRVLKDGGEIHFKTDNEKLFAFSLPEFSQCALEIKNVTDDLHRDGIVGIMTGYEEKFHALGTKIHRCECAVHKSGSVSGTTK